MSVRDTIIRSVTTVWPRAVSLAAALSQPRTDVEASDAALDALVHESVLARSADGVARRIAGAWDSSRARSIVNRSAEAVGGLSHEDTIRAVSWTVVVASVVVLLLDAIRPTPAGPLAWVLPTSFAAVALATLFAALPLARAWGDRRS